jgi:hypothetical protein
MPAEIHLEAGLSARLVFRREETAPCSERVVFPDLGISVDLPAFQDVAIDLPACEPGTHRFRCQMDMLHGNLVVEPNGAATEHALMGRGGPSRGLPIDEPRDRRRCEVEREQMLLASVSARRAPVH